MKYPLMVETFVENDFEPPQDSVSYGKGALFVSITDRCHGCLGKEIIWPMHRLGINDLGLKLQ